MDTANYQLVQGLVSEEIGRIVEEASRERRILKAGPHAFSLQQVYPNCGLSAAELVNEIAASAACAGVPVELSRAEAPAIEQLT